MARLHLWEIHEQAWCPPAVRDGATDCLTMIARWGRQYDGVVPKVQHALRLTHSQRIIDLCSGSGGPWPHLYRHFRQPSGQPVEVWLTDLYPNIPAMRAASQRSNGHIRYVEQPVDVTQLDHKLDGFRTLFTAFHHFPPHLAKQILQDAVCQGQGIALFEQSQRSMMGLLLMWALPLIALVVTPFVRPFRLSRLFWTYVLPAIPLVLLFDGLVSCLRTYSEREMAALVTELEGRSYIWTIGRVRAPFSPIGVGYAIGYPRDSEVVTNAQ